MTIRDIGHGNFIAVYNGERIASANINWFSKECGADARHLHKSFVLPGYRGKGVGRLLYDAAEDLLRKAGLRLVPSPQNILSRDAFAFWQKRDPALVADDSRNIEAKYLGKTMSYKGDEWVILSVANKYACIESPDKSATALVSMSKVFDRYGKP